MMHLWFNECIESGGQAMSILKAIRSHFSATPVQYHKPLSVPTQDRLDSILSSTAHGRAIIATRTTETPAPVQPAVAAPTTPRSTTTARPASLVAFTIPTPRTTTSRQWPQRVPVDTSRYAVPQEPRNSTVATSRKHTRHSGSKAFGMTVAQFTAAQRYALKWNDPTLT
jgi:hypothetical protein